MNIIRKPYYVCLFLLAAVLIISGCQKEAETEKANAEAETKSNSKAKTPKEQSIPKAARNLDELINQESGKLMQKHMDKELEGKWGWAGYDYINYYDKTFKPLSEKALTSYFSKHKNLDGDQAYDYLFYMLGSGQYKEYYEKLKNYEHSKKPTSIRGRYSCAIFLCFH
jgi:Ca-activated chloride channel homolog